MRTAASVLAVLAVAAVTAAAVLDVLRDDELALPDDLSGQLVYSDPDCRRHALRLPDLARRDFLTVGCGVFTRRDNLGVKDGVVGWFAHPDPGGVTILLRNPDVREVAWLGRLRFAAAVDGLGLTIWERDRLVAVVAEGSFRGLRASPTGRYFAAGTDGPLAVFDRDGEPVDVPPGHAIAWSPGERYAAVAGEDSIAIVPAGGGKPVAKIPLSVADLDWQRG